MYDQGDMQGLKRQRVGADAGTTYPDATAGVQAAPAESSFPVVKLRGLPFDVSEYDIRVFLADEPVDMLMMKRDGRFSGEAIVVLPSVAQVEMAVAKNRTYLGRRYVEVFKAKKLDYYKAVVAEMTGDGGMRGGGASMMARGGMGGGGVMGGMMDPSAMGGMMMGGLGVDPSLGMMDPLQYQAMQAASMGGAYGQGGGLGVDAALGMAQGYIGPQMGGMGGGGFMAGMGGVGMGGGGGMGTGRGMYGQGSTVLKLRGLPYACTEADLVQWFDDPMLGITPLASSNVHMINDGGRFTGMAYVEFPTPQEASAAMMKNKQHLGNRYIEMFPASRLDMDGQVAKRSTVGY